MVYYEGPEFVAFPFALQIVRFVPLRMAFDFYSKKAGRSLAKSGGCFRIPHDLDGVHRLRLHPFHTPSAGMSFLFRARAVPHAAVGAVITNMRSPASGIPVKKETRPSVVVHRFRRARWWHSNFEHAYKFIFENHFVTIRSSLHSIEAIGETPICPVRRRKNTCRASRENSR